MNQRSRKIVIAQALLYNSKAIKKCINGNDNKLVVIRKKDCTDENFNFNKNQDAIPAFLFERRQPTSHSPQQAIKIIDTNQLGITIFQSHHTHI